MAAQHNKQLGLPRGSTNRVLPGGDSSGQVYRDLIHRELGLKNGQSSSGHRRNVVLTPQGTNEEHRPPHNTFIPLPRPPSADSASSASLSDSLIVHLGITKHVTRSWPAERSIVRQNLIVREEMKEPTHFVSLLILKCCRLRLIPQFSL